MSSTSYPAARRDDEISHTCAIFTKAAGAVVGAAVGIALGAAVTVVATIAAAAVSGPGAIVAFVVGVLGTVALAADGATIGSDAGALIASYLPSFKTGTIQEGVASVLVGLAKREHAAIDDDAQCMGGPTAGMGTALVATLLFGAVGALVGVIALIYETAAHMGATIAQGCMTISVEKRAAARLDCACTCGAKISTGETSVLLGQKLGALPGYEGDISETPSLDMTVYVGGWVGTVASVVAAGISAVFAGTIMAGLIFMLALAGLAAKITETINGDDPSVLVDGNGWRKAVKGFQDIMKEKTTVGKVVYGIKYAADMLIPGRKVQKTAAKEKPELLPTIYPTR